MRISTTFLLFELASIAWAAPRPVNVGQPNAQARSVAFAHGVAPDQNPALLGRGASPIYTREKKSPNPSSTTADKAETEDGTKILFRPKGRGISLKSEQQPLVQSAVTAFLKVVVPNVKPNFPSACSRFDELKTEVPPGGKPAQVVTFTFEDKKICGGYCTGFLDIKTRNGKIRKTNGNEVHPPRKQSSQSSSRHSGSTAPGNPDGPATRPVGRDVGRGASPIHGQENANLGKRFWPFTANAANKETAESKEILITYVNNGGRPASNQEQNMIKQHTTQFLTTTEAKKILPNPKLGQLCPTIQVLGDHYKIVSFEFEDKTHGKCRGDLNLIDGKGRIEDANGKLIYPAESKALSKDMAQEKHIPETEPIVTSDLEVKLESANPDNWPTFQFQDWFFYLVEAIVPDLKPVYNGTNEFTLQASRATLSTASSW
ncbi:hypothetical protein LENED_012066 [Lentinula edodes]|uniref:Uncharacterized protein n=1 Tax=Lentinula edodes TaxID=5353 RepID=A0A1Q3ERN4_LENED|nr:hypothetical protein LENED_012066 [Lentinula edodes]